MQAFVKKRSGPGVSKAASGGVSQTTSDAAKRFLKLRGAGKPRTDTA